MRAPSARMAPHTCTITYNTWGTDVDGGRQIASATKSFGVSCFVQPGKAHTVVDTSDETGYRRVTEITPTRIFFFANVHIKVHDLVQWVDSLNTTHNYVVVGYYEPGGLAAFWRADCQETI